MTDANITAGVPANATADAISPYKISVEVSREEFPPPDWPQQGEMHFRLEDPVLGRLELSCENGYVIREYDFAPPVVREVVYNNSFDDGTYDYTRFIGSRAVTLDIVLRPTKNVNGTGPQYSEPAMRDALLAYMHPGRRPRLLYSEHGDNRVKQVDLRAADFSAVVTQPRFNSMSLSWVAPRGVIESSWLSCETQYIGELAGANTFPVNNRGNVNSHWTVTIAGELQQPVIWLDNDIDNALELEYDITLGNTIVINSLDRSVRVNGERTGYRYLSDNSTWFTIPPGSHTVNFGTAETTRVGYPFAEWEDDGVSPYVTWASDGPHLPADDPAVPPPWAWSTDVDPNTGIGAITSVTLCYRSTWI